MQYFALVRPDKILNPWYMKGQVSEQENMYRTIEPILKSKISSKSTTKIIIAKLFNVNFKCSTVPSC